MIDTKSGKDLRAPSYCDDLHLKLISHFLAIQHCFADTCSIIYKQHAHTVLEICFISYFSTDLVTSSTE